MADYLPLPDSLPVVPARPDRDFYGPETLELFPRLTRATYTARYGKQPPVYNPQNRIKRWWDSTYALVAATDPQTIVQYKVLGRDKNNVPVMQTLTLTALEAATPNFPGVYSYARYEPAPTTAVVVDNLGLAQGINPLYLSTYTSALLLARALKSSDEPTESVMSEGGFRLVYGVLEDRREWNIQVNGTTYNVGMLLARRHSSGVDAPGAWSITTEGPVWIPAIQPDTGAMDVRPEVLVPCRDLLPGEEVRAGFGNTAVVVWAQQAGAGSGGGGLTPAQAETLNRIDKNVTSILKLATGL